MKFESSTRINPFVVFDHHLESRHPAGAQVRARSGNMANAVKLFSQVHTAVSFQVNIKYCTSFCS